MKASIKVTGVDALLEQITNLQRPEAARSVALAFTYSALSVIERACKNAMPGSTKQEVGKYVRVTGDRVWGRAGLIRFPRQGDGQNGPHGVYLDQGTKFIPARRYISTAISGAMPSALEAGKRAAQRRIDKLTQARG